jgi:hypothetical protein
MSRLLQPFMLGAISRRPPRRGRAGRAELRGRLPAFEAALQGAAAGVRGEKLRGGVGADGRMDER